MENSKVHYLYRHIRLDKNEPFYIGVGTANIDRKTFRSYYHRAFQKNRNNIWKAIYCKTAIRVEILFESDDYKKILEKEKFFISLYGQINNNTGILANISSGGEGVLGVCSGNRKPRTVYVYDLEGAYLGTLDQVDYFKTHEYNKHTIRVASSNKSLKSAYGFQFSREKKKTIKKYISNNMSEEHKARLSIIHKERWNKIKNKTKQNVE